MVLRDRVAAALYADRLDATDTFVPSALAILVYATALHIESQGQRRAGASPTLAAAGSAATLEFWDPAAVVSAGRRTTSETAEPPPSFDPPSTEATVRISRDVMESYIGTPELESESDDELTDESALDQEVDLGEDREDEILDLAEEAEEVTAATTSPALDALDAEIRAAELESDDAIDSEVVDLDGPDFDGSDLAVVSVEETYEIAEAPDLDEDLQSVVDLEEAPDLTVADLALEPLDEAESMDLGRSRYADSVVEDVVVDEITVEEVELEAVEIDDFAVEEIEEAEEVDDFSIEDGPTVDLPTVSAEAIASAEATATGRDTTEFQHMKPEAPSATIAISTPSVIEFSDTPAVPDRSAADEDEATGDGSEDKTAMLRPEDLDIQPPKAAEPRPDAPEPVAPAKGGSTQVTPPADLDGPGWAFRQETAKAPVVPGADEEATALHDEARRLARLLVSEIKLYNEEQVDDGRRNGDIYSRLQDDIERSRQMYRDRVDARVGTDVDYFQQELVNILAGGDPNALGM
jgi:hypothetical protein